MATAATPLPLSVDAQASVVKYVQSALSLYATSYNIRSQMELRDRAYYREQDSSGAQQKASQANNSGDPTKLQNVTVPVVMPQVETALADLTETFLTGYPIFATVTPPELADAGTMMDTIIGENSTRCGWPAELAMTMREGLKYDLGAVEVTWQKKKIFAITTPENVAVSKNGNVDETYYEGNFITRLDPYNLILDTRVSPEKNHLEGEFAGYSELVSRIAMKKRMEDLPALGTMNFKAAFETPGIAANYVSDSNAAFYIPQINPGALLPIADRYQHNWLAWANLSPVEAASKENTQDSYQWTVMYCRILPSDFKMQVKNRNHVQIWKFIVINNSTVIFAERQTNAHNYLPIIVCKPSADGMSWQSKSFAENVIPSQQAATSLMNSGLESQRRKVYDRIFYDASRINKKDIDVVSSVARIAVKNSGYGKPISEAIYQVPYRDDGVAEIFQTSQSVAQMGDIINGQNRVSQGQFQKGNKTRAEFDTTMGNANSRGRLRALNLEYTFFVPIKEIVKSNILQYQSPITLTNSDTKKQVEVDPEALRKANLSFALSDGYLPADKMVSGDQMAVVFQAASAIPAIAAEYDLMGMFAYSMKLKGARWLNDFKRTPAQTTQYMQTMQQAGTAAGTPPAVPNTTPN